MNMREITPDYFVAPQIDPSDLPDIAAAGIKAIICNRPDMEIPQSHHAEVMEQAALAAGVTFHVLPLTHQSMTPSVIAQQMALAQAETPVLAYCASGTRCTVVWALGCAARGDDVAEILATTKAAGYALDAMRPALENAASSS